MYLAEVLLLSFCCVAHFRALSSIGLHALAALQYKRRHHNYHINQGSLFTTFEEQYQLAFSEEQGWQAPL